MACLALALGLAAATSPEDAVFVPGTLPLDTDGNQVHAHGGGMLQCNGTFWLYGTTQKLPPAWISAGISLYSSPDLQTWTFEGQIFNDSQIQGVPFSHPYRIERPKILHDARSGEYTMLFHLDTPAFELTSVGVAKAASLAGPWRFVRAFKPDGLDSYDMTAWQDGSGGGYLVRSIENRRLGVSRLTADFSDTTGVCASTDQAEAPAVFSPGAGSFLILASHLTGWAANPALQFAASGKSLCEGGLRRIAAPAEGPGSQTTFNSQPAFVFPLALEDRGTLFIAMLDRWNFYGPGCVGAASFVWLPLLPRVDPADGYELMYLSKWSPRELRGMAPQARAQALGALPRLLGAAAGWLARLWRGGSLMLRPDACPAGLL